MSDTTPENKATTCWTMPAVGWHTPFDLDAVVDSVVADAEGALENLKYSSDY